MTITRVNTEADWLSCGNPDPMLEYLRDRASERKLRLFACACVCRALRLGTSVHAEVIVDLAEQYAEGLLSKAELLAARAQSHNIPRYVALAAVRRLLNVAPHAVARDAAWFAAQTVPRAEREPERQAQSDLLRDLFGNPFQPVRLNPAWQRWNDACVVRLARAIYEERAFDRLPVLADALEEAGCEEAALLDHCRSSQEHIRGCWLVDLLLGQR